MRNMPRRVFSTWWAFLAWLAAFLLFSAIGFGLGEWIGVFDHDPADEGGERRYYQPPTGERRF